MSTILKIGDTGAEVLALQKLLIAKGYKIDLDGDFGGQTETAVKQLEQAHGLTVDGEAGDEVMKILGTITPVSVNTVSGIDISCYQNNINWAEVVAGGIKFVYIKASEGLHTIDTLAKTHALAAKAAGLKIGYYHFGMNSVDATLEAKFFDSVMKTMPIADLPAVLDIETNNSGLIPAQMDTWINNFLLELKELGYAKLMIYSGPAFLNENLPSNHNLGFYPLWLAEYTNAAQPSLPHGWDNYTIWQYNGAGVAPGVTGQCDLDKAIATFLA